MLPPGTWRATTRVPALISLKVTKPEAPDLTLIDLPGIVRNPIGDQPEDIEQQIRGLIHKHIEGANIQHCSELLA